MLPTSDHLKPVRKFALAGSAIVIAALIISKNFRDAAIGIIADQSPRVIIIQIIAVALALLIELLIVGWNRSSLKQLKNPSASFRRDILIYVLSVSSGLALIAFLISGSGLGRMTSALRTNVADYAALDVVQKIPSTLLQAALAIIISDFALYWGHRAMHRFAPMWELHKYHHSATELRVFTAARDNPLTSPILGIFLGLPFVILGSGAQPVEAFTVILVTHANLIHSSVEHTWGPLGRWLIVSPHYHRVHHSSSVDHYDRNFAFLLPIWDRIFGTYYDGTTPVTGFGVDDEVYNKRSPVDEMMWGMYSFGLRIFEGLRNISSRVF